MQSTVHRYCLGVQPVGWSQGWAREPRLSLALIRLILAACCSSSNQKAFEESREVAR